MYLDADIYIQLFSLHAKNTGLGPPSLPPPNAAPWPRNPVPISTRVSPPTWINYATIFGYRIPEHIPSLLYFREPWFLPDLSLHIVPLATPMLGLPLVVVNSWFALGSEEKKFHFILGGMNMSDCWNETYFIRFGSVLSYSLSSAHNLLRWNTYFFK